jgi:hypothetical protein
MSLPTIIPNPGITETIQSSRLTKTTKRTTTRCSYHRTHQAKPSAMNWQQSSRRQAHGRPRSKQVYIGPSEIGHACTRRIAYKLLDWDKANEIPGGGNWAAQVGTAIHAHLAEIFGKLEDYEVEQKVTIRSNLTGTVDLFDKRRGIVMDWKTTNATGLEKRRKEGATGSAARTSPALRIRQSARRRRSKASRPVYFPLPAALTTCTSNFTITTKRSHFKRSPDSTQYTDCLQPLTLRTARNFGN